MNTVDFIREATILDLKYIDKYVTGNVGIGFIPKPTIERIILKQERFKSRFIVYEENLDLVGFSYYSIAETTRIFMMFVQEDARRFYRASRMVSYIEDEARNKFGVFMKVRVANHLESNDFWKAMGYLKQYEDMGRWLNKPTKGASVVNVYFKALIPTFFYQGRDM